MSFPTQPERLLLPKNELVGIQYLRGLAAVMVVIDHLNIGLGLPKYFFSSPIQTNLHAGAAGVNLFFVVSGFIIGFISLRTTPAGVRPRIDVRTFLWRRFARIVPFLWVCVISYAAFRFVGRQGAFGFDEYLRALFLYPIGPVNPSQVWTLRHELLFYLMFSTAILPISCGFWILYLWFLSPFLFFFFSSLEPSNLSELLTFLFSRFNILFGMGFTLSILHLRTPHFFAQIVPGGMLTCTVACILYIFLYVFVDYSHERIPDILIVGSAATLMLCLGLCVSNQDHGFINRIGKILGDASYSIYLTHGGFVSAILGISATLFPGNIAVVFLVTLIVVSGLGILTHYVVEVPLVRFFQSLPVKRSFAGEVS
jgi:exopolysaccharide production protein ExoZ